MVFVQGAVLCGNSNDPCYQLKYECETAVQKCVLTLFRAEGRGWGERGRGNGGAGNRCLLTLTIFNLKFLQKLSNLETLLDILWQELGDTSLLSERDVSIVIIF